MLYCCGCGTLIGADAAYCSRCGARQTVAPASAAAPIVQLMYVPQTRVEPGPKGYIWGYIQGSIFTLLGLGLLPRMHTLLGRGDCVLMAVLGFCILRKSRLIIPLLCVHIAINVTLALIIGWFDPQQAATAVKVFAFGLIFFFYYMNRKDEFTTWI